jgi:uncharacterized ParB-like nuclease family protein
VFVFELVCLDAAPHPSSPGAGLTPTLQIDVLLVDGQYYGFSGCHRFEAHQRLGLPTIRCRVRKANQQVLKMHMM